MLDNDDSRCRDCADHACVKHLPLALYVLAFLFAATITFLDRSNNAVVWLLDVVTLVLVAAISAIEVVFVCASAGSDANDPRYVHPALKFWYLIKNCFLLALLVAAFAGATLPTVSLSEIALLVLAFEGAAYAVTRFQTARAIIHNMRVSCLQVGTIIAMIVMVLSIFAFFGWVLFKDITPEMLLEDGVLGPDTLFPNFWFSFITLWGIAQADNIGDLTRALERLRPGSAVFLMVFNFLVYYLMANVLIATFTQIYQNLDGTSSAAKAGNAARRSG